MAELDEELTRMGLSFTMKGAKLTGRSVMRMFKVLGPMLYKILVHPNKASGTSKTSPELTDEKESAEGKQAEEAGVKVQTVDEMLKDGQKLENIDISELEDKDELMHMLRKYDIDCSLRVDDTTDPPTYHVFFKADDTSKMLEAVKDYANLDEHGKVKKIEKEERVSPKKQLERTAEKQRGMEQVREKVYKREMEH